MRPHLSTGTLMMPKSLFSARRMTALLALSLLTVAACSEDGGGVPGGSTVAVVQIVTVPNAQTLTNLTPGVTRQMLGVPTNDEDQFIDKTVSYSTSNAAVFTVSPAGLVTAVAGGNAYLRATAGSKTDSVLIGVRYPVATVNISNAGLVLRREGAQQLTATTIDTQGATVTGRTITWSTSDAAIVSVSATGLATAQAAPADGQTATITATVNNAADGVANVAGTRLVTITGDAVVATVTITGVNAVPFYGHTAPDLQLTATARSGLGNVIGTAVFTWTTTSAATATVGAANGLVNFVAPGTVTVRATAETFVGSGVNIQGSTAAIEVATGLVAGANAIATLGSAATRFYAVYADSGDVFDIDLDAGTAGDLDMFIWSPGTTGVVLSVNAATGGETANPAATRICVSAASGNSESCNVNPALSGWFRIGMAAWALTGAFVEDVVGVTATYTP
jgi:hypothetical protein